MKTIAIASFVLVSAFGFAQEQNATGFYYPTGSSDRGGYFGFLGYNPNFGGYHLADDFKADFDSAVYAVDDGVVVRSQSDVGSYGGDGIDGGAFIVQSQTSDGRTYFALYGHINVDSLPAEGSVLGRGTQIARVGHYYSGGEDLSHVHFGIMPDSLPTNPYDGYTTDLSDLGGFVNPWTTKTVEGTEYVGFLDSVTPTPEPATMAVLGLGLVAVARRRKRA